MSELERSQNLKMLISRWKINQKYIKVTEYLLKKVNEQKQSPMEIIDEIELYQLRGMEKEYQKDTIIHWTNHLLEHPGCEDLHFPEAGVTFGCN